ncbi:D-2-hydroxyacid dehydrogenase [Pseudoduganella plicata]|uniref:D-2-hydroxyacid dehydrogenase n=1 Tax=Pseudoduganella plicata TaxID=321984 RepID=A0A4P7BBL2_9BURK|nr:D-2-hydroxyacid dehydrogenase [Pseudoduganella plicata]QBQ34825.1 D-2-hydroxyacid dehydrogenase [Pseudoduganella plicata]GGY88830.1 glycerate dehydrogenase [Pseudoduganella plicata]
MNIVFLDRASLVANVRRPAFVHAWTEYDATTAAQAAERLRGAAIAITNKVPLRADTLAQLPDLKLIAVAATGTDIVDLAAARERGIVVCNIRDYAYAAVPEHTFALILALRRNLLAYRADVEAGAWQRSPRFCLFDHPIRDLHGSRLGLVGFGALGRRVAQIGRAFGMEIAVHTRTPVHGVVNLPLDELLATSDIVSLHVPLKDETRNLIGAAQLAAMKRTSLLINTARGGLVDEAALADALTRGVIAGAGFDVLTQEPPAPDNVLLNLRLPNFILTPHNAWASFEAMQGLADQLIDNVEAFVAGAPRNVVG